MKRREFLQSTGGLLAGLVGPVSFASSERPFSERLELLREHISRLESRRPSRLLKRGLAATGLKAGLFTDLLAGLLFAREYKASSEEEQQDERWIPLMEAVVPRFTESLAALMNWMETRRDERTLRRLMRRPNRVAAIVSGSLFRKRTPQREQELRKAMAEMSSFDTDIWDQMYTDVDILAAEVGTTRTQLADDSSDEKTRKQKLVTGLLLLFGGALVGVVGIFVTAAGIFSSAVLTVIGVLICIAAAIMMVAGIVYIIMAIVDRPDISAASEEEALDEDDLALLTEVQLLCAA